MITINYQISVKTGSAQRAGTDMITFFTEYSVRAYSKQYPEMVGISAFGKPEEDLFLEYVAKAKERAREDLIKKITRREELHKRLGTQVEEILQSEEIDI